MADPACSGCGGPIELSRVAWAPTCAACMAEGCPASPEEALAGRPCGQCDCVDPALIPTAEVISFADAIRARARAKPIESYHLQVDRMAEGPPDFTLLGLGNDVEQLQPRDLVRDLLRAAIMFSNAAREAGRTDAAVAFVTICADGNVTALTEPTMFQGEHGRSRRAWLDDTIAVIPSVFAGLLDDPTEPPPLRNDNDGA